MYVQLTGERGEQTHQEIYAIVVARPTSLSFAQDCIQELHEAGSIGETSVYTFWEEKERNHLISNKEDRESANLHRSEYLIRLRLNPHPVKFIIVKSAWRCRL